MERPGAAHLRVGGAAPWRIVLTLSGLLPADDKYERTKQRTGDDDEQERPYGPEGSSGHEAGASHAGRPEG